MDIRPLQFNPASFLPAGAGVSRSPGLHLSDIIRYILSSTQLHRYRHHEVTQEDLRRFEIGFLWEEIIGAAMVSRYSRANSASPVLIQQEITRDGIVMTPDLFDIPEWRLLEFKATWKSSRRRIQDEYAWLHLQIPAYLTGLQSRACDLMVLHVNGDYSSKGRGAEPHFRGYRLHYSPHELRECWEIILRHKDKAAAWKQENRK